MAICSNNTVGSPKFTNFKVIFFLIVIFCNCFPLDGGGMVQRLFMMLFVGICYGGNFNIVTVYLKKHIEKPKQGLLIGGALMSLQFGGFVFGNQIKNLTTQKNGGVEVGDHCFKWFFIVGCILNQVTLPIAFILWKAEVQNKIKAYFFHFFRFQFHKKSI